MKRKPFKVVPVLIAFGIIALVCGFRLLKLDFVERLERMTYDMRAREALRFAPTVAANLGFISMDDSSIDSVRTNRALGFFYGLYWPRSVYGRVVQELAAQGAKAVAFDIVFGELRHDHPPVQMADGSLLDSDDFFALQIRRASNVVIAVTKDVTPPALFTKHALALGDISTEKDPDGILRRAKAFRVYRKWHSAFRQLEADPDYGVDLRQARIEPRQIVLPRPEGAEPREIKVPLDQDGNFDLADFGGSKLPPGVQAKAKPFTEERVWHMGVVLAALELKLDLTKAEVDLAHGEIRLRGAGGAGRTIPVDADGYFYIDWCMPLNHPQLMREPIQQLLAQSLLRLQGQTNLSPGYWSGKLAVVGSSATGNDLTDRGATPIAADTLLVSKHWNVANSIITGRFVRRAPLAVDLAIILLLGMVSAVATWKLRVLVGSGLVWLLAVGYVAFGTTLYVQTRYWIPLVLPVGGALVMTYASVLAWRVVFEQAERRRVKTVFSKVVSPKIVNELLKAEMLALGGARREITVLFADVRGFTDLTDKSQERVTEFIRKHNLSGEAAEKCQNEQAEDTLNTVNTYLGLVADILIEQNGTLDKFIGDCVMVFWGAPAPNPHERDHAAACVRAAIEAQRAIDSLNKSRAEVNKQLELDNLARVSAGLPEKPLLPILLLGSGINTGMATVGMMGSKDKQQNYTVFGREVNLASRLEGASGRGRIFISQATYEHLLRDDPELAATCVEQPPAKLKGFSSAAKVYEVPWQEPDAGSGEDETANAVSVNPKSEGRSVLRSKER